MVAIDRVGYVYPSVHLQHMLQLAQKPAPYAAATPVQYGNQATSNDPISNFMNGDTTQKISPSQFGLDPNNPSLQFSTPGGGFVQVFGPLQTPGNDKFFHDPNPMVISKKSKPVTYVQKINLAYYKPPAPPAPGPVIIKEVRIRRCSLRALHCTLSCSGSPTSGTCTTSALRSHSTTTTTGTRTTSHPRGSTTTPATNSCKCSI